MDRTDRILMADPKTKEDVEIARVKAATERDRIASKTIIQSLMIVAAVLVIWILAWAAVRMSEKPAWLELALAAIGGGGPPTPISIRLYVLFKRTAARLDTSKRLGGTVESGPAPREHTP
jgi:hypothetical protein